MDIMQSKFSPSINIIRDFDSEIEYVLTPNARQVFQQISKNYEIGTRAFNIVGSYGTGKSAFLLALEQHLCRKKSFFDSVNGQFNGGRKFKFINIVGDYASIVETFARQLEISDEIVFSQKILTELDAYYQELAQNNISLAIVIDEFGKFLEYASANEPERELYFIQQLAEFANDPRKNVLLITVLHQGFDAYARNLTRTQRQEWEKVKGRLKEIQFNEPVEQLLFLAAERIKTKAFTKPADFDTWDLIETIQASKVFPLQTVLNSDLAESLYPLDTLAAAVLTKALQRYGQNERSLFSFLEADDYLGLSSFNSENEPYYNLCSVYDYLIQNYSALLTTKYNPDFLYWRTIQHSIDRVEATLEKDWVNGIRLVKIIGLLNLFSTAGAKIDHEFLQEYAELALGMFNAGSVLKQLESKKIIRFLNYKGRFILYEGTDLDIEIELQKAEEHIERKNDIVIPLRHHFSFPYISAKAVQYRYGTPRYFQFQITDTPTEEKPKGAVDGIINLIFPIDMDERELLAYSQNVDEAILFGYYRNTKRIQNILFEIEKIEYVLENVVDDHVAERELRNMLEFRRQELNYCVLDNLYQDTQDVIWIYGGQKFRVDSRFRFNQLLSEICQQIYSDTPVFKNELINRERLPSTLSKARRNLIEQLINNWEQEDLGFGQDEFPPEKTIYLSLLKKTGIHRREGETFTLSEPTDNSFKKLWDTSEAFLRSARVARKSLSEFVEILSTKPLKLKRGFIEFWLPIFLFIRREDYALFGEEGFVPHLNPEALELLTKHPHKFQIKSFELQGVKLDLFNKYRTFLQQTPHEHISTTSFIETIKPFLSFYKGLPEYAKRTRRLSQSALNLREAIATATDPEKTFFEDFPAALGYSNLNLNESPEALADYVVQLQNAIRELRSCFDALLNRIENHLLEVSGYVGMSFAEYQSEIRKRYASLKTQLLLPHQTVLYRQLQSELDDRNAWLRAIVQALLGKPMEKMRDEEEELVLEKISNAIWELDNLCDISKIEVDPDKEELIKLEMTTLNAGSIAQIIRIPKKKEKDILRIQKKVRSELGTDRTANIAALIKLLQDEISNG